MITSRLKLLPLSLVAFSSILSAQILFVPGGTSTGIGASSTGNVGIGTNSPTYKLSVEAGSSSYVMRAHAAGDFVFALAGDGWGGTNLDLFSIRNNNTGIVHLNTINGARLSLGVSTGTTAGAVVEQLSILASGCVGIGTTAPSSILHLFQASGGANQLTLDTGFSGGNAFAVNPFITGISNGGFEIRDVANNAARLVVQQATGNVGIGTTNPTQKLSVDGTIRAKEVIVDTGWSDYVFADDYRLAPLSEIETQIKAERHLPGIPSAQEIAEHGVSMGEMQSKLLAKIEELTLHAIAQEKRLATSEKRTVRLENENKILRGEILSLKQSLQTP